MMNQYNKILCIKCRDCRIYRELLYIDNVVEAIKEYKQKMMAKLYIL
jgi:hypothetical protein